MSRRCRAGVVQVDVDTEECYFASSHSALSEFHIASGAPVFDVSGSLVGLHHLGFARDNQCKPIDHVNKAIKISDIVGFLRQQHQALLNELEAK